MEYSAGHAGAGPGSASSGGKRKRGKGSGSSSAGQEYPGDPPTGTVVEVRAGGAEDPAYLGVIMEDNSTAFKGVRVRVHVEIKSWAGKSFNFFVELKAMAKAKANDGEVQEVVKDTATLTLEAAIIHDLARLYSNAEHPVTSLNIDSVERRIRKQDLKVESPIGKGLLDEFVRENLLTHAKGEWPNLKKEELKALKGEIVELGPKFLKVLKKEIAKESSLAGRHRKDEAQILDAVQHVDVEENDPAKGLEKEIQHLKALLEDKVAEIASLRPAAQYAYQINQTVPYGPTLGRPMVGEDHIVQELFRAGLERQGEAQILPAVQHVEESEHVDSEDEIKRLNALLKDKDALIEKLNSQIASLKRAAEYGGLTNHPLPAIDQDFQGDWIEPWIKTTTIGSPTV